ncbi:MAG: recombinase family protein, partial [Oscillospiraceae bacterium]
MLKKYQAAAYLRLSVAGSRAIESESIENQEYIIARFVKENLDIELVSSYADSGHSGLVFDRPAFLSMMSDAKAGKINCIIVKDLSRFGRDFIETGRYLQRILPAYGIRFISILDHVDTLQTPPQEDIVMQIKTIINDEFSREISARTRSSLQIMRKSGLYVGACPIYGYQKSADTRNKLVPDENTTPVVAQIFNLKLAGMSAAKIANRLNEEGILSPLAYKKISGLPQPHHGFADKVDATWSAVTILRILKDETYTGTLVQGKQHKLNYKLQKNVTRPSAEWVRCNNAHEAIISLQDFETVQRILLLDTRASPSCDYVNLFSGLLICGSCQSNMTRKMVRHGDIVYRYYYCPTGKRRGCVAPTMISEDVLTAAVFDEIWHYIEKAQALSKEITQMTDKEILHLFAKEKLAFIEAKQAELQKLCEYKSSLKISEVRGVISAEECRDMDEMYGQEICKLEKEILAANNEIHAMINHIDQQVNRIAAFA